MRLGTLLTTAALALGGLAAVPAAGPARATTAQPDRPAVLEARVIGHSVRGRPIRAWRLGEPGKPRVLLVATMHGDEGAPRQILTTLRDGRPVRGLDLWVLPVYNPDGLAAHTRKNAHGVDLNRNFPYHWADLDGSYESGPRAGSEPETRAMMRFLRDIHPRWIVSFHQPLDGVDTDTKDRRFSRRLARALRLPRKSFTCGGVCHGTMTGWFNSRSRGAAVTVEYGARPGRHRMTVDAPRQILSLWGARRGQP
ncbi:M14 family zinc carboxypeptidase [Nocardioides sp.]|uniref:M14 family zinc carboxypeptidase n=1 Tax=Nocardioides sp. TaxID=35761 RepID=UPI00378506C5